jgi:hypothetical protein
MSRIHSYCLALVLLLSFVACTPTEPETKKTDEAPAAATPDAPKDLISGTWVLNVAKSKYDPAGLAPKSGTVKYELSPDGTIKGTTDGVDSKGRKTHSEYTAKMDGPSVPTNGTVDGKPNPDVDATAWKRIDDHNYEITQSLKGQTVYTFRIVIAEDGKSRTSTQTGKNSQGQAVNNEQLYEKQ